MSEKAELSRRDMLTALAGGSALLLGCGDDSVAGGPGDSGESDAGTDGSLADARISDARINDAQSGVDSAQGSDALDDDVARNDAEHSIVVANFALDPAVRPWRVSWDTFEFNGTPLLTIGELRYRKEGESDYQTSGPSNDYFVSHLKATQLSLDPDTRYECVVVSTAEDGGADEFPAEFTTPALASSAWDFERYHAAPLGMSWTVLESLDQGPMVLGTPRITMDQTVDGVPCYRHSVRIGDNVENIPRTSDPIDFSYRDIDRILWRHHFYADGYSGDPGKHMQAMVGHGYQGDKVGSDDHIRLWLGNYAATFDDLDCGFCCVMHPDIRDTQNQIGLFATHAVNVPNDLKNQPSVTADLGHLQGVYFGDVEQGSAEPYPLDQWNTVDIIAHRTEGWSVYLNGILRARSSESNNRILDDWDIHRAIWWMSRHMHGGNPEELLARFDYNEWFGGFYIAVA